MANPYSGILSLEELLRQKRQREMTHFDSYSQSQPAEISFEGLPE